MQALLSTEELSATAGPPGGRLSLLAGHAALDLGDPPAPSATITNWAGLQILADN